LVNKPPCSICSSQFSLSHTLQLTCWYTEYCLIRKIFCWHRSYCLQSKKAFLMETVFTFPDVQVLFCLPADACNCTISSVQDMHSWTSQSWYQTCLTLCSMEDHFVTKPSMPVSHAFPSASEIYMLVCLIWEHLIERLSNFKVCQAQNNQFPAALRILSHVWVTVDGIWIGNWSDWTLWYMYLMIALHRPQPHTNLFLQLHCFWHLRSLGWPLAGTSDSCPKTLEWQLILVILSPTQIA
jgi:hypothetical protein